MLDQDFQENQTIELQEDEQELPNGLKNHEDDKMTPQEEDNPQLAEENPKEDQYHDALSEITSSGSPPQSKQLVSSSSSSVSTNDSEQQQRSDKSLREWTPLTNLLSKIPVKAQRGLTTLDLKLTCIAAVGEFIALGTNVGLVYWFNRSEDTLERLKTESTNSPISILSLVSSVDYMLAAGNNDGLITIFQIPKSHPNYINNNKPEVRTQTKRFAVDGLHNCVISALEWSSNGMKLFSGDISGIIIMTDIDYDLGRISSRNLLDEKYEIVQLSYSRKQLLVCSTHRSVVYSIVTKTSHKVGMQDRKMQGKFGGIFHKSIYGDDPKLFSVRPGGRIWVANCTGTVEQTIKFKDMLLQNHHSLIPVINPSPVKRLFQDFQLGILHQFMKTYLVTHHQGILYILDPINTRIVGVCQELKQVIDLSVNDSEIFILESDRNVIRLSSVPEKQVTFSQKPSDFFDKMGKIPNIMSTSMADFRLTEEPINYLTSKLKETSRALPKINSSLLNTLKNVIEIDMDIQEGQLTVVPNIIPLKDSDISRIVCDSSSIKSDQQPPPPEQSTSSSTQLKDRFQHISQLPFEDVLLLQPMKTTKKMTKKVKKFTTTDTLISDMQSDTVSVSSAYSTNSEGDTATNLQDNNRLLPTTQDLSTKNHKFPKYMSQSWSASQMTTSQDIPASDLESKEEILARKLNWPELLPDSAKFLFDGFAKSDALIADKQQPYTTTRLFLIDSEKSEDYCDESSCDGKSSITTLKNSYDPDDVPKNTTEDKITDFTEENEPNNSVLNVFEQSIDIYSKYAPQNEESPQSGSSALSFGPPSGNSSVGFSSVGESGSIGSRLEPRIIEVDEDSIPNTEDPGAVANVPQITNLPTIKDMVVDPVVVGNNPWVSYKAPASLQSIHVCENYIVCTDSKQNIYYSSLDEISLRWIQTEYQASQLAISSCGSVLWRLYKGILYSLMNPCQNDAPILPIVNAQWSKLCKNVIGMAVQKQIGWIIKSDGHVYACEGLLESAVVPEFEKVNCQWNVTQLCMLENTVWAITMDGRVIYRSGITEDCFKGTSWVEKIWEISIPPVCAICTGPGNSIWIADVHCNLYFITDVSERSDGANAYPWKVSLNDFNLYSSSNELNSNGSHTSSFSFTSLKNKLTDSFKSDRIASLISSKSTPIICGSGSTIWYSTCGSLSLCVCKNSAEGHGWMQLTVNRSLRTNVWNNIFAGSIYKDHGYLWLFDSKGKLFYCKPEGGDLRAVDLPCSTDLVCITPAPDALWILNSLSVIYARDNISSINPIGHGWDTIDLSPLDNVHFVHISCGSDVAWGCDNRGNIYMRVGSLKPTRQNDISPAWVHVEGSPMSTKDCIFTKVYVGTCGSMVWALDNFNDIYVREAVYPDFPIGTRWLLVSGIKAIRLALSDKAVWALSPKGEIFRRQEISTTNFVGDCWKKVPGTAKVLTVSVCDEIWALDTLGQLVKHSQKLLTFNPVKKTKRKQVVLDPEDKDWEFVESL